MAASLFSPHWYRVASLKPRLRGHAQIHRHVYRGQLWYVLQDHSSGRFHRVTPAANLIIGLINGKHTVQEIWEIASERLGDDGPTQDETIELLAQLHGADILQSDVSPDALELFRRYEKQKADKMFGRLRSPLALRFPLLDPERIVTKLLPVVQPLFGWFGGALWLVVVGTALVLAGMHWSELSQNITDRVFALDNLVLLWLTFPVVKALHEFGHAFATKARGGEVHEMGVMLLVLMPVPYVDASSSSAFRDKRHRMVVGAAGMLVELFVASLAMFVWLAVEPGTVRAVAYNVMLIAGVSTVLFNGNPLVRFDGYYILADFLEIPNLGARANRYMGYLAQRYLFGLKDLDSPVTAAGEGVWFAFYAIASLAYRLTIMFAIVLLVAGKYFIIGVVLATWAALFMVGAPLYKAVSFMFNDHRVRRLRSRSVMVVGGAAALIVVVLFALPLPLWTQAEGVVWIPEKSLVRAQIGGFVEAVEAKPNSLVNPGDLLFRIRNPAVRAHVKIVEAQLREMETRYDSYMLSQRVQAEIVKKEIAHLRTELASVRQQAANLEVRSRVAGRFVLADSEEYAGRYVGRGRLLGYVLDASNMVARVAVSQEDAALVRKQTQSVYIRLANRVSEVYRGDLKREVPAATRDLPSLALSVQGGGRIALDPNRKESNRSFKPMFYFDVGLPPTAKIRLYGDRVYVRFNHGREPLFLQWYRNLRQLFLRRFSV